MYGNEMDDEAEQKVLEEIMDLMGSRMAGRVGKPADLKVELLEGPEGKSVEDGHAQGIEGLAENSPEMDDHEGHLNLQGLEAELSKKGMEPEGSYEDASPEESAEEDDRDDEDDMDEAMLRAKGRIY